MTRQIADPAPRRMGWPLRLLLLVSLGLNLLVAGVVAGHMMNGRPERNVPRVDRMIGPLTFALSEKDRREIGRELRREYRTARPSHDDVAEEYRGLITALRANPFDPSVVETVLDRQAETATTRLMRGQTVLMDRISGMSTQDRSEFADRLEEGLLRMERRLKDRKPGPAADD
ncbi:periplasmic heavy metal sensor [Pseudooceanicola sp. C21-150M6]|uniref:periplasmic heavy metal sensor n=1 Tax=Pseudooceanicola sp. C21-150M6 TaxID=3434355 RepID=UPI003D7FC40E